MITYNHEKFIREAIDGVLSQQTNFGFELIIANDCSPDKTDEIVNEYINTHPKGNCIKYFSHKKNLGMIPNFIFAMEKCKGRYIALCEGDDYWTAPLKLQKQVDFLEPNSNFAISFHATNNLDDNKLYRSAPAESDTTYSLQDIARMGNILNTCSVVFRNGLINTYPDCFYSSPIGDYIINLMNAKKGKIKYFSEVMSVYRINVGNWSSIDWKKRYVTVLNLLDKLHDEISDDSAFRNGIREQQLWRVAKLVSHSELNGGMLPAIRHLLQGNNEFELENSLNTFVFWNNLKRLIAKKQPELFSLELRVGVSKAREKWLSVYFSQMPFTKRKLRLVKWWIERRNMISFLDIISL